MARDIDCDGNVLFKTTEKEVVHIHSYPEPQRDATAIRFYNAIERYNFMGTRNVWVDDWPLYRSE